MSALSLVEIESSLHQLLDQWQEAPPEQVEQIEALIREHLELEVKKVDGIRRYLSFASTQVDAAKAEAAFQLERARLWEARADRLKAFVMEVMKGWGRSKLEGSTGPLRIQGNGGKQPVIVTDLALVPDELCRRTVTMPESVWKMIVARTAWTGLQADHPDCVRAGVQIGPREASLSKIAAALSEACPKCFGRGSMVVVHADQVKGNEQSCPDCRGSKMQSVAGARLGERGESLRVR